MHPQRRKAGIPQAGSVLLITLLFTGLLAMLSVSFSSAMDSQVETSRDNRDSLRAELAAHSGLEFARQQLYLDPLWNGTSGEVQLNSHHSFTVTRLPGETSPVNPTVVELVVEGRDGTARFRLESSVTVTPGDLLRTKVLAPMGGLLDVKYATIHGEVIVPDQLGVVWDWDPGLNGGAGDWKLGGPSRLDGFVFGTTTLDGKLYKYTNALYISGSGSEHLTSKPLRMPKWNLDSYLAPGPDRILLNGVRDIQGQTFEQTVVLIPDTGQKWLLLDDNNFRGGLVLWTPPDTDLRNGLTVDIRLQHVNTFGGGSGGVHPHVGLIAPTAVVRNISGLGQSYQGFNFWNEVDQDNWMSVNGQLVVVNQAFHIMHADLTFNPAVVEDPPPGIEYAGPMPAVDVSVVKESYQALP